MTPDRIYSHNNPPARFRPGPTGKSQFSLHKQLKASNTLEIPEMKKFAGKPLLSLGNDDESNQRLDTHAALSMQEIEEAVELASAGRHSVDRAIGDATPHFIKRNVNQKVSNTNVADFAKYS